MLKMTTKFNEWTVITANLKGIDIIDAIKQNMIKEMKSKYDIIDYTMTEYKDKETLINNITITANIYCEKYKSVFNELDPYGEENWDN